MSTMKLAAVTICSSVDRVISKYGICNVIPTNVPKIGRKFMTDIFTTLLEARWRWTLLAFCLVYFVSWTVFAVIWYAILYLHGDIDNYGKEGWNPCVTGIQNFTGAFLFSVETQHTTGYGFYYLSEVCSSAILTFCFQSIVGCILEGLMVGLVFVKVSRAKKRSETIMFSKNAVMRVRDGVLYFMFRVADMRQSHLLDAHIRAQLIRKRVTREGEVVASQTHEFNVGGDGEKDDKILLFWPTTIVHRVDDSSPLRNIKMEDLSDNNDTFEIIVVLEGIVESSGLNVQARSSYLPSEILWAHKFKELTTTKTRCGMRLVDYSLFHEVIPICTDENDIAKRD